MHNSFFWNDIADQVLPPAGVKFSEIHIKNSRLIELEDKSADGRITFTGPPGNNLSIFLGEEMLTSRNWNLVIQGRGKNEIKNLKIAIASFSGRLVISCPDGDGSVAMGACGQCYGNIYLGKPSHIVIGDATTINGADIMNHDSFVHIGKDCMFSKEILLQASDQHAILDRNTREILNGKKDQSP